MCAYAPSARATVRVSYLEKSLCFKIRLKSMEFRVPMFSTNDVEQIKELVHRLRLKAIVDLVQVL